MLTRFGNTLARSVVDSFKQFELTRFGRLELTTVLGIYNERQLVIRALKLTELTRFAELTNELTYKSALISSPTASSSPGLTNMSFFAVSKASNSCSHSSLLV